MKAQDNSRADEFIYPQLLLDFAQAVMRRDQASALRILEESARQQAGAGNTKLSNQIKDAIATLRQQGETGGTPAAGSEPSAPAPAAVGTGTARFQPAASSLPGYLQLPENWQSIVNDLKVRRELFRHDLISSTTYVFLGTWNAARATAAYLAHMLGEQQFRHSPLEALLVREGEQAAESFKQTAAATEPPSVHLVEWADADFGQRYPHLAAANARIQDSALAATLHPRVDLVTIHHQPPSALATRVNNQLPVVEPQGFWLVSQLGDALGSFAPKELDRAKPNTEAIVRLGQAFSSHPEINIERVYSSAGRLKHALILSGKSSASVDDVIAALTTA